MDSPLVQVGRQDGLNSLPDVLGTAALLSIFCPAGSLHTSEKCTPHHTMVETRSAALHRKLNAEQAHIQAQHAHRVTLQHALNASIVNKPELKRRWPFPSAPIIDPLFPNVPDEVSTTIVSHMTPGTAVCYALTSKSAFNFVSAVHNPEKLTSGLELICMPKKPYGSLNLFGSSDYECMLRLLVEFIPELKAYVPFYPFTEEEKPLLPGISVEELLKVDNEFAGKFHPQWQTACWILKKRMEVLLKKRSLGGRS